MTEINKRDQSFRRAEHRVSNQKNYCNQNSCTNKTAQTGNMFNSNQSSFDFNDAMKQLEEQSKQFNNWRGNNGNYDVIKPVYAAPEQPPTDVIKPVYAAPEQPPTDVIKPVYAAPEQPTTDVIKPVYAAPEQPTTDVIKPVYAAPEQPPTDVIKPVYAAPEQPTTYTPTPNKNDNDDVIRLVYAAPENTI